MNLIQNTLCPSSLSSGCIRNTSETVDGAKLKLSAWVEGDVEETQGVMRILLLMLLQLLLLRKLRVLRARRCYVYAFNTTTRIIVTNDVKGIKVKLLGNV